MKLKEYRTPPGKQTELANCIFESITHKAIDKAWPLLKELEIEHIEEQNCIKFTDDSTAYVLMIEKIYLNESELEKIFKGE